VNYLCGGEKRKFIMADDRSDLDFDLLILVSRGDELPKKNYEKKKHPTYEVHFAAVHMLSVIQS
jgi:hypothetical protein